MKSWQLAVVCLASLAAAACRNDSSSVTLLERENRDLEDQVYQLADRVETRDRQNTDLREQLARAGIDVEPPADLDRASRIAKPSRSRPAASGVPLDPNDLPSAEPEMPSGEISADQFLQRLGDRGEQALPREPKFPEAPRPAPEEPLSEARLPGRKTAAVDASYRLPPDHGRVARITLHDTVTGGYNMDGQAGDEGIVIVVRPRDAEGRLIEAPAPVTVVVLDPALSGEAARVARWDFTAEEVAARCGRSGDGEGIRLEMVWPADPPQHDRLHLFVRYRTDDGRALEADREIRIERIERLARRNAPAGGTRPPREANRAAPEWQRKPASPEEVRPAGPLLTAPRPTEPPGRPPAAPAPDPRRPAPAVQRPVWSPERR